MLSSQGDPDASGYGEAPAVLSLARERIVLEHAEEEEHADQTATAAAASSASSASSAAADANGRRRVVRSAAAQEEHSWRCALAERDGATTPLTLLNLLHAPRGSALRQVADIFARLEQVRWPSPTPSRALP